MQPKCVLIVDDQPGIRALLGEVVADIGYRVLLARTGQEALDLLSRQPDLILLDMNMPGMSGLETLGEVRTRTPDLPVLMITGTEEQDKLAEATALGVKGCIQKPFDITTLKAVLGKILK